MGSLKPVKYGGESTGDRGEQVCAILIQIMAQDPIQLDRSRTGAGSARAKLLTCRQQLLQVMRSLSNLRARRPRTRAH